MVNQRLSNLKEIEQTLIHSLYPKGDIDINNPLLKTMALIIREEEIVNDYPSGDEIE